MQVLVANAGSSNLKLRVLGDQDELLASAELPVADSALERTALERFLETAPGYQAVGHRFVHGGAQLRDSALVDERLLERLRAVSELAPLHNPRALQALELLLGIAPELAQVACFDTTFHASLPPEASLYAVPRDWTERLGVRRFGFHGLSHAYAARRAAELIGGSQQRLRVVTCHLGAGASLAAVRDGRSVDTTMGFTPAEGLVMATRSGNVDPGAITWLQRQAGLSAKDVEHALEHESGLRGLAGSGEMQDVIAAADRGDERARVALDVYLHRLRAQIAAMAAATEGLDALVFTGGVGERSARVRAAACDGLAWLGLLLDESSNAAAGDRDAELTAQGSRVRVFIVLAREDVEIAAEVRRLIA